MSSTSASKIVAESGSGHHLLKIEGYSSTLRALPSGQGVMSRSFTVAGHRWNIGYYPNGVNASFQRYISLYLFLSESAACPVTARVQFSFPSAAEERHRLGSKKTKLKPGEVKLVGKAQWACAKFVKRADLEKSNHLVDDSFSVMCDIVVLNGLRAEDSAPAVPRAHVTVPPSDLGRHLRGLLETGIGADATFEVAGERFAAHRWLLAARSPTFSAELFERSGAASGVVRVENMDPRVFKALLSFMYTDSLSLPETATTKQDEVAFAQHLLLAAHRYGMERLKLLCEDRLCKSVDVGTAANILALAEPLGCRELKDACMDFLMSSGNLCAAMARDDFENLRASCPSLVTELISRCHITP